MNRFIAAGCLMLGFTGSALYAAEEARPSQLMYCREELRRVFEPAHGPKSFSPPRSRMRNVWVCDKADFTLSSEQASRGSK